MSVDLSRALRKAGKIIMDEAIAISSRFAKKTPASMRLSVRSSTATATISAGGPSAPAAVMFETPRARHPLFGNEEHWYYQPYRPFLEQAAEAKSDDAMQAFADDIIDQMLNDSGILCLT
jgi:hypothetical protein